MGGNRSAAVDRGRTLVNHGEVWWVEAPEVGARPHLVLTRQAAIRLLHDVIAVPATRTIREIPTTVRLGREDGMPDECVLTLDNITIIPRELFTRRICRLGPDRINDVFRALDIATGCA